MIIKNIFKSTASRLIFAVCLITATLVTGCKKYLTIPLPVDKISGASAFTNDQSAAALISNILGTLSNSQAFDGESIGFQTAEYSDELTNYSLSASNVAFYRNAVTSNFTGRYWTNFYTQIYNCNLAIEGIGASTEVINFRNQWIGEALFLRAFLHFSLTNLYGDVPLVTSSDFRVNNVLTRTSKNEVYKQVITDLLQAQSLLSADYRNAAGAATTSRNRPNKMAATALLARVYLYAGEWTKAEEQANLVIANTAAYQLPSPTQTFSATSKETIWSFAIAASTGSEVFAREVRIYYAFGNVPAVIVPPTTINTYGVYATLSPSLVTLFENTDQRLSAWTTKITKTPAFPAPSETYYLISKYKSIVNGVENIVMLRLAEQYLIRAEARAQQDKIIGSNSAQSDINIVRARAGLTGTTAIGKNDMLNSIMNERRVELFTEHGHRFFDLKRTGTVDAVMSIAAPLKGGTWSSLKQIWPIPASEIFANPNLTQAPGYN